MVSEYQRKRAERVESLTYLQRSWEEYQQERSDIRSDMMRKAGELAQVPRAALAAELHKALERPEVSVADLVRAMKVTRQTLDTLLAEHPKIER